MARRALISGLGIAGPTLAYWLRRSGWDVTVVEAASQRRTGGYIIDFWGIGYDVAEKMGLLPRLSEIGYFVEELRIVGADGGRVGGFDADVFRRATDGRYVSLPRGDLSSAILQATPSDLPILFGDEIEALAPSADGVDVSFKHAPAQRFDLVFGADGLHSRVRELCFGPQSQFETYLGYKVAAFEVSGYAPRAENVYVSHSAPGKQIARFAMRNDRTMFLFVFIDGDSSFAHGRDAAAQAIRREFSGLGWESADILQAMERADDIYFDRVSQIRMPNWTKGRVALLGDAAFCPSLLAGEGSAFAMAAAYILAGELARAGGDHAAAFARYEQLYRPFIAKKQKAAVRFAASFAPKTRFGIALRNAITRAFDLPFIADIFFTNDLRDDITLPEYA